MRGRNDDAWRVERRELPLLLHASGVILWENVLLEGWAPWRAPFWAPMLMWQGAQAQTGACRGLGPN